MSAKKTAKPAQKETAPIIVSNPSIIREKMNAITTIAQSNLELAKALNSVNLKVEIKDSSFTMYGGTAVQIEGQEVTQIEERNHGRY